MFPPEVEERESAKRGTDSGLTPEAKPAIPYCLRCTRGMTSPATKVGDPSVLAVIVQVSDAIVPATLLQVLP